MFKSPAPELDAATGMLNGCVIILITLVVLGLIGLLAYWIGTW